MTPAQLSRLPEVLFEIGKAIGSDENVATLLTVISELVTELVGADAVSIMFLDAENDTLFGKAAYGLDRDIRKVSFRVGEGVAGWVAQHGEVAKCGRGGGASSAGCAKATGVRRRTIRMSRPEQANAGRRIGIPRGKGVWFRSGTDQVVPRAWANRGVLRRKRAEVMVTRSRAPFSTVVAGPPARWR